MSDNPRISVIIVAYTMKRWDLMRRSIHSVIRQTRPPSEVIIGIDDNEKLFAVTKEWITRYNGPEFPSVTVVHSSDPPQGDSIGSTAKLSGNQRRYSGGDARNAAAAVAQGDILVFLDDDAVAEVDWLEKLIAHYTDPQILAVGGAPEPDFETPCPAWFPKQFNWVFGCAYEGLPKQPAPILRLIGANMSVRADAFRKIGGFHCVDFDDMDMCHRVAALGGPRSIYYTPLARVRHYVPAERVSWHYFWRRCFYVNRDKVTTQQQLGDAASFEPDVRFVIRTVVFGATSELRKALGGDRSAWGRIGAILVGVGCSVVGNVAGSISPLRAGRSRSPVPVVGAVPPQRGR